MKDAAFYILMVVLGVLHILSAHHIYEKHLETQQVIKEQCK